jgi:hypothetical protein
VNRRHVGIFMLLAVTLAVRSAPAFAQCCGDCNGDGQVTIDEILQVVNRALNGCVNDGICVTCTAQLTQCQADLASCESQSGGQRFPATGQTTCWDRRSRTSRTSRGSCTSVDLIIYLLWGGR